MAEFIFVVERIEWDHDTDGIHSDYEDHTICRAFKTLEAAKSYVETNAAALNEPYNCRWHGSRKFSGSYEDERMRFGLTYLIHYIGLT